MNNFTVTARNSEEVIIYHLPEIEIVGPMKGLAVTDNGIVTTKAQRKWFYIEFANLGNYACLTVDYKDGVEESYGDEHYCRQWKPGVKYVELDYGLENPMQLDHTY